MCDGVRGMSNEIMQSHLAAINMSEIRAHHWLALRRWWRCRRGVLDWWLGLLLICADWQLSSMLNWALPTRYGWTLPRHRQQPMAQHVIIYRHSCLRRRLAIRALRWYRPTNEAGPSAVHEISKRAHLPAWQMIYRWLRYGIIRPKLLPRSIIRLRHYYAICDERDVMASQLIIISWMERRCNLVSIKAMKTSMPRTWAGLMIS